MDKAIFNIETGKTEMVPLTTDEMAQQQKDEAAALEQEQKESVLRSNETVLRVKLNDALAHLEGYRALNNPTAAQTVAVVKLLCVVAEGLARRNER